MRRGVLLEEMVLAAVSGELELGADADDGPGGLGPGDGLLDVAEVGVEVHGPLVEVAGGHPQKPHLAAAARTSRLQSLLNWIRRPGKGWSGPRIRSRRAADLEGLAGGRRTADGDLDRRRRRLVGGGARPGPTVVRWSGARVVVAASSAEEEQLVGEGHWRGGGAVGGGAGGRRERAGQMVKKERDSGRLWVHWRGRGIFHGIPRVLRIVAFGSRDDGSWR